MKLTPDDPLYLLSEAYPNCTREELEELRNTLNGILEVFWSIFERLEGDPVAKAKYEADLAEWKKQQNKDV